AVSDVPGTDRQRGRGGRERRPASALEAEGRRDLRRQLYGVFGHRGHQGGEVAEAGSHFHSTTRSLTTGGKVRGDGIKATAIVIAMAVGLGSAELALGKEPTKAEQQAAIRKETQVTLAKLYKASPGAKQAISKAAGYAAFDNFGMNLLLLSTAHGKGIAVAKAAKNETFMKVLSVGAGLGVGAKDFRVVFVFETPRALDNFIHSGCDADAHA